MIAECGIYQITNTITKQKYIGQSINIKSRWINHKNELNKGIHHNCKLQESWNKYGSDVFIFEVLILCDKQLLKNNEKQYVEKVPKNKRFNISKNYDNLYGINNPFYGKKHTKKTKNKLSQIAQKRILSKNSNYGNIYSKEIKIKTGHNKKTKLKTEQVNKIISIQNKTHQEIANIYGVSRTMITRIKNGTRWNLITNIKEV